MSKIIVDIPPELLKSIREGSQERPYDICLNCEFMGNTCDGPNAVAMDHSRWLEWVNKLFKKQGRTRAQIADAEQIPKSTIDSVLSGRTSDVRLSTFRALSRSAIGGCWGKYPCHLAALIINGEEIKVDERITELQAKLEHSEEKRVSLQKQLDTIKEDVKQEVSTVRAENERRVDYLKDQVKLKEETIKQKEQTIGLLCLLVLSMLVYDNINPNVGWFRADETVHIFIVVVGIAFAVIGGSMVISILLRKLRKKK